VILRILLVLLFLTFVPVRLLASVDDQGIEALRKSHEEETPGSKAEYRIKVRPTSLAPDAATATLQNEIIDAINGIGGAKESVQLARHVYTGTPVTTSAYTQIVASLADDVTQLYIFDSSGRTLYLAVGAPASEVDTVYIVPGGNGLINLGIDAGSRVSIKAVDATANKGELSVTFLK